MREELILVNENDEAIGVAEKIQAHLIGAATPAFSIFIFNRLARCCCKRELSLNTIQRSLVEYMLRPSKAG